MDYTNISLNELNQRIDMVEMAVALGYQEDKSKSWRGGRCFVFGSKDSHTDRIFIQPSKTQIGMQHFSSTEFDTGGNGSAMLVKHALQNNLIPDPLISSNDPRSFDINRKVAKIMCNHLSIPDEDRKQMYSSAPVLKKGEPFDEELAKRIMAPGIYTQNFIKRGINKETFLSPTFAGTWYNTNKDEDTRRHQSDLCFPCYRADGSVGGLNFRYYSQSRSQFSSVLMTNSEHSTTLWHSNIPDKIDRIFIAESEFDCMAHHQLTKQPNTLYVSHQGFLIPSQIDTFFNLMISNKNKLTDDFKLQLGADNDVQGSRYDIQFILAAANLKKGSENAKLKLDQFSESGNIHLHIDVRADLYDKFKNLTNAYLNKDNTPNIEVSFDDQRRHVSIVRPNSDRFANIAVCELLTNSDLLVSNIRREKSVKKDWNDDLKMLNKINATLWNDNHFNDLGLPKRMDYPTYRALSQDHNFHYSNGKDFRKFLSTIVERIPDAPDLVEKKNLEVEAAQRQEEKYRQAQAETKASKRTRGM